MPHEAGAQGKGREGLVGEDADEDGPRRLIAHAQRQPGHQRVEGERAEEDDRRDQPGAEERHHLLAWRVVGGLGLVFVGEPYRRRGGAPLRNRSRGQLVDDQHRQHAQAAQQRRHGVVYPHCVGESLSRIREQVAEARRYEHTAAERHAKLECR